MVVVVVLSPLVVLPAFVSAAVYFIGELLNLGVCKTILLMTASRQWDVRWVTGRVDSGWFLVVLRWCDGADVGPCGMMCMERRSGIVRFTMCGVGIEVGLLLAVPEA